MKKSVKKMLTYEGLDDIIIFAVWRNINSEENVRMRKNA